MGTGASKLNTDECENQTVTRIIQEEQTGAGDDIDEDREFKIEGTLDNEKVKEDDTLSMDSKDSTDTNILVLSMADNLVENQNGMERENTFEKEKLDNKTQQNGLNDIYADDQTVRLDSSSNGQAGEQNQNHLDSVTVETRVELLATIEPQDNESSGNGRNIMKQETANASEQQSNDVTESKESKQDKEEADNAKCKLTASPSDKQTQNTTDTFEAFKRKYGVHFRKRSIANKQTLILTKVGTKFQLLTVPAYLPGQRLYRSSSWVKNHIPNEPMFKRRKGKSFLLF